MFLYVPDVSAELSLEFRVRLTCVAVIQGSCSVTCGMPSGHTVARGT